MNHRLFPRALVALAAFPLAASLACASHGPEEPKVALHPDFIADTAAAIGDGRSMEDLFSGRFPGVTVTRADGGGLQIRIRGGNNTFYGSNEPLIVVDDTPLAPSRGIVFLNPHDIQRIEVLKNPADIGIYGVRGGNGVVKITTLKPGRR